MRVFAASHENTLQRRQELWQEESLLARYLVLRPADKPSALRLPGFLALPATMGRAEEDPAPPATPARA
jgi:hypothetical protein